MNKTILAVKKASGSIWLLLAGICIAFAVVADALIALLAPTEFFSDYTGGAFRLGEIIDLASYSELVQMVSMYSGYVMLLAGLLVAVNLIIQYICYKSARKTVNTLPLSMVKAGLLIASAVFLLHICGLVGIIFGDIAKFAVAGNTDSLVTSCIALGVALAVIVVISTFYGSTRRSISSIKRTLYTGVVMGRVTETSIATFFILAAFQGVRVFTALTYAPPSIGVGIYEPFVIYTMISSGFWALGLIFIAVSLIVVRGSMRKIILQGVIEDRERKEKIEEIEAAEAANQTSEIPNQNTSEVPTENQPNE